MWIVALAMGFAAWRVFYLRRREKELDLHEVTALAATSIKRWRRVERLLAIGLGAVAPVPIFLDYVSSPTAWLISGSSVVAALLLATPASRDASRTGVFALGTLSLGMWALASTGYG